MLHLCRNVLLSAVLLGAGPALAAPAEKEPSPVLQPLDPDKANPKADPQRINPERVTPGEAPLPTRKLEPVREEPKESLVSYERFTASGQRLTYTTDVVHRGPDYHAALQGFNFRFRNGWHKIRRIGALYEGGHVRAAFNDDGGEDPFDFSARYIHIDWDGQREFLHGQEYRDDIFADEVTIECAERCSVPLRSAPATHTALLAGFQFTRRGADDYNVRALSITLLPDRRVADVQFYDDRDIDFSGGRFDAGLLLAPPPLLVENIANNEARRLNYELKLQVLYIPRDLVLNAGRLIGGTREDANAANVRDMLRRHPDVHFVEEAPYALMGFGIAFGNSDHFLQEFGVDPEDPPVVRFQDGDTDDPISWFIDYVALQPEFFE